MASNLSAICEEASPKTPAPVSLRHPPGLPLPSAPGSGLPKGHIFPSTAEMVKRPQLPPTTVYRFVGSGGPSRKVPRPMKPGERFFSKSGSPLMMPPMEDPGIKIPIRDEEGKKLVECVIYKGVGQVERE